MAARLRALLSEAALLLTFFLLLSVDVAIIEHMDSDEVGHFVVHLFALAELESEVLIFLSVARLSVLLQIIHNQIG